MTLLSFFVIPAQAGIQRQSRVRGGMTAALRLPVFLDSRLRGNDGPEERSVSDFRDSSIR
jgi:hypothetical protein